MKPRVSLLPSQFRWQAFPTPRSQTGLTPSQSVYAAIRQHQNGHNSTVQLQQLLDTRAKLEQRTDLSDETRQQMSARLTSAINNAQTTASQASGRAYLHTRTGRIAYVPEGAKLKSPNWEIIDHSTCSKGYTTDRPTKPLWLCALSGDNDAIKAVHTAANVQPSIAGGQLYFHEPKGQYVYYPPLASSPQKLPAHLRFIATV